jgi:hypothetical protein
MYRLRKEKRQIAIKQPETPDTDWNDFLLAQRSTQGAEGAP